MKSFFQIDYNNFSEWSFEKYFLIFKYLEKIWLASIWKKNP